MGAPSHAAGSQLTRYCRAGEEGFRRALHSPSTHNGPPFPPLRLRTRGDAEMPGRVRRPPPRFKEPENEAGCGAVMGSGETHDRPRRPDSLPTFRRERGSGAPVHPDETTRPLRTPRPSTTTKRPRHGNGTKQELGRRPPPRPPAPGVWAGSGPRGGGCGKRSPSEGTFGESQRGRPHPP